MGYLLIITIILLFILFCNLFRNKNGLPTNWPLVGMLPALLKNIHRISDYFIEILEKSNSTFHIKIANMHLLNTVDPANLHHVLSKSFGNYVKGSKLQEILEPLGDGILNADSTIWLYHRTVGLSFFNHPKFNQLLVNTGWKKVKSGLIPILDHASNKAIEIDMEDLFLRFMYDTMSIIMLDHDPNSLSVDLPNFPLIKAVADMERAAIFRHLMPTCMWKFLRWLNVGTERKVSEACIVLDDYIYKCIDRKREERRKGASKPNDENNEVSVDLLTLFMDEAENTKAPVVGSHNDKFLRDTIANFFLAGGEATSTALAWFFCLLSKNPQVVRKIKEELDPLMTQMKDKNDDSFLRDFKELLSNNKLVYLHAAICESLRLYPSVPFFPKAPNVSDTLPSGHRVDPKTQIFFSIYAMARMKSIWGEDCNEYKPERWISKGGLINHEPSYKFSVFGAGPRNCLGKAMVFTQMKVMAALILPNYHIEPVEKNHVPDHVSIVLHMKNGFKVTVSRS